MVKLKYSSTLWSVAISSSVLCACWLILVAAAGGWGVRERSDPPVPAPWPDSLSVPATAGIPEREKTIGFYLWYYKEPSYLLEEQLNFIRHFYPRAPIYVSSDGGDDYTEACAKFGCHFQWASRIATNISCEGSRHFKCADWTARLAEGLRWLETDWVVFLEPDCLLVRQLSEPPPHLKMSNMANVAVGFTDTFLSEV